MTPQVVNLAAKLAQFEETWSPRVVAQMNDYYFKVTKLEGDFVWHSHDETDEAFLVLSGTLHIELREREVTLSAGELFVVPRGVEHRPHAKELCHVLMIEPREVANTGDELGERTVEPDVWI